MLRSLKQNLTRFIGCVTYFGILDVPISLQIFDSINLQTWIIQNNGKLLIVRRNNYQKHQIDLVASCVNQVDKLVSFLPSIIPQCIYSHDCLEIRLQACPRKNNELIPNRYLQKSTNVTTNNFANAYSRFAFSSTNYGQKLQSLPLYRIQDIFLNGACIVLD